MEAIDMKNYMADGEGRLVPVNLVSEIDKTRDSLVKHILDNAIRLQEEMKKFKDDALSNIQAFVELSAMEYGVHFGGKKGNMNLASFDGMYKVQIQISEHMEFDERLAMAKQMIDQCIERWTVGSRDEVKALINDAFQVNKKGLLNKNRILTLRRLDIKDELWRKAMKAISDSLSVTGSSTYLRLYQKDEYGKWVGIALDMSKL